MIDIFFPGIRPVFDFPYSGTGRQLHSLHPIADKVLDFILQTVRQLIAVSVKKLDPVKFHGIMGCGYHHARFHLVLLGKIRYRRRGNDAYINGIRAYAADSRHQRIGKHIS